MVKPYKLPQMPKDWRGHAGKEYYVKVWGDLGLNLDSQLTLRWVLFSYLNTCTSSLHLLVCFYRLIFLLVMGEHFLASLYV